METVNTRVYIVIIFQITSNLVIDKRYVCIAIHIPRKLPSAALFRYGTGLCSVESGGRGSLIALAVIIILT